MKLSGDEELAWGFNGLSWGQWNRNFLAACGEPSDVPCCCCLADLALQGACIPTRHALQPERLRLPWCLPCAACRCGRLEG